MAEPVLRDPASTEPVRPPGPQPVLAAATIDPSHELPPPPAGQSRDRATPAPRHRASGLSARPPRGRTPSQEMLEELRHRLEHLRERVERRTSEAGTSLKRELKHDADYVKVRARFYHERRPLQTLGMVAAAGFVLGVFVGLWRR